MLSRFSLFFHRDFHHLEILVHKLPNNLTRLLACALPLENEKFDSLIAMKSWEAEECTTRGWRMGAGVEMVNCFPWQQRGGWFITVTTCRIVCLQPIISTFQIVARTGELKLMTGPNYTRRVIFMFVFKIKPWLISSHSLDCSGFIKGDLLSNFFLKATNCPIILSVLKYFRKSYFVHFNCIIISRCAQLWQGIV